MPPCTCRGGGGGDISRGGGSRRVGWLTSDGGVKQEGSELSSGRVWTMVCSNTSLLRTFFKDSELTMKSPGRLGGNGGWYPEAWMGSDPQLYNQLGNQVLSTPGKRTQPGFRTSLCSRTKESSGICVKARNVEWQHYLNWCDAGSEASLFSWKTSCLHGWVP